MRSNIWGFGIFTFIVAVTVLFSAVSFNLSQTLGEIPLEEIEVDATPEIRHYFFSESSYCYFVSTIAPTTLSINPKAQKIYGSVDIKEMAQFGQSFSVVLEIYSDTFFQKTEFSKLLSISEDVYRSKKIVRFSSDCDWCNKIDPKKTYYARAWIYHQSIGKKPNGKTFIFICRKLVDTDIPVNFLVGKNR